MRRFVLIGFVLLTITVFFLFLFAQVPEPQSQSEQMKQEVGQPAPQQPEETPQPEKQEQPSKPSGAPMELKGGTYSFEMPPKSLDNYYPPIARKAKNYKAYMDTLGRRFYDLMVDVNSVDLEVLEVSYVRFKDYYSFVANLVPEWKDRFLLSDVEELGKALGIIKDTTDTTKTSGKKEALPLGARRKLDPQVNKILEKIEYSCNSCHIQEIPRVYFRYYWHTQDMKMNMATFMVKDPMTRKTVPYRVFKSELAKDYYATLRLIDKGSKEKLREHVMKFVERFNYNQSLCSKCHTEDPYLFTTPTIATLVKDLDDEAHKRIPNKERLRRTLYELYNSNCTGCHRIHYPATYIQRFWYDQLPKPPSSQVEETPQQPEQPQEGTQPGEQQTE